MLGQNNSMHCALTARLVVKKGKLTMSQSHCFRETHRDE